MSLNKRLKKIYNSAETVSFGNKDKLVFFSDVHRGNNSWADEFAKNETVYTHALQYYYDNGFTYVEVGDGDELLKFKYLEPIRIAHEGVYRLLQKFHHKKRLYYIFGNHDIEYRNPELVHIKLNHLFNADTDEPEILFDNFKAHEGIIFQHKESGLSFFTFHGHQADDLFHRFIWLNRVLLRALWRPLQLLGFQDPSSVAQNIHKRERVEKSLSKWARENQQAIICGHTHDPRLPKRDEAPYFNDGSCVHPRWITCLEIENGQITLVRWRIQPDNKGRLVIKRKELKGPKPLENYVASVKPET
jgi:UDP-2,3-diacylglucosamine pyrophosphatase LpxH